jgi:hypothetical protein
MLQVSQDETQSNDGGLSFSLRPISLFGARKAFMPSWGFATF